MSKHDFLNHRKTDNERINLDRANNPCPKLAHLYDKQMSVAVFRRKFESIGNTDMECWWNHYSCFVSQHPSWSLLGFYTGEQYVNKEDKRCLGDFERMKRDCHEGKIDLILIKSVSQLSRNLIDCLSVMRDLNSGEHPVGMFVEDMDFYTLQPGSEFILTLMLAMAEEESRNKNKYIHH